MSGSSLLVIHLVGAWLCFLHLFRTMFFLTLIACFVCIGWSLCIIVLISAVVSFVLFACVHRDIILMFLSSHSNLLLVVSFFPLVTICIGSPVLGFCVVYAILFDIFLCTVFGWVMQITGCVG